MTMRIALDESHLPGEDNRLFFIDKFQEIKSTHRLRAYMPLRSLPTVLKVPAVIMDCRASSFCL